MMYSRLALLLIPICMLSGLSACGRSPGSSSAAVAAPAPADSGAPDRNQMFGPVKLTYTDTTTPEWRAIARKLDSFYAKQVAAGFNGAVLLGYKGHVMYERYFGWADKEAGVRWHQGSASQLASTTKTFTSAAILLLHQGKFLNIEDKVTTYLPDFPYPDITVKMLLNHRSGLIDYYKWMPGFLKDTKTPIGNDSVMKIFVERHPKQIFRTNSKFDYSNSNYLYLASIIEAVSDMTYKDFMKKYIFDPLGMKNTFVFDAEEGFPAHATVSYAANWAREPLRFDDGVYGDKGIHSTVQDMYRWDQSFYQHKLLTQATQELAYAPCSFETPGVKNYGLGWRMLCYPDGNKIIFHNGWWHGNNTCFTRFIDDNFTIVVLGNKLNKGIYRQPPVLYRIVTGDTASREGFGGEEGAAEPAAKSAAKTPVKKTPQKAAAKKVPVKKPVAAKKAPAKKPVRR